MEFTETNEFRLFAHGETFDPDAFLTTTALKFDGVWHKSELANDHPKSNGVFKVLGDGQSLPIFEQEQIAIEYLAANREALKLLAQTPGVTTFIIGLHYQVKLEEGTVGFAIGPSAPLMRLALDIGIDPTYYIMINMQKERESPLED